MGAEKSKNLLLLGECRGGFPSRPKKKKRGREKGRREREKRKDFLGNRRYRTAKSMVPSGMHSSVLWLTWDT